MLSGGMPTKKRRKSVPEMDFWKPRVSLMKTELAGLLIFWEKTLPKIDRN